MKAGPLPFRITGVAIFLQLLLGGLLTFGFITVGAHIVLGFIVSVLAIASMVAAWVAKPPFRPIRIMSVVLVLLLVLQIILGFAALGSGSRAIDWLHFVNALAIYGIGVSVAFMSMRWEAMSRRQAEGGPTGTSPTTT